jgi:ferredoxin
MGASLSIEIGGARHRVPEGITLIQTLWAFGKRPIHGVGCLGGVCGACIVGYRLPNEMQPRTGLACQTLVREGMSVTFLPSDALPKATYPIPDRPPTTADLIALYPETRCCTRCGACSVACPQGIDVMGGVQAALKGEFGTTAEKFADCVMCGLCAMVCDVQIRPHRVGLWARRMQGIFAAKGAGQLDRRLAEVNEGKYEGEWSRLLKLSDAELQAA